MKKFFLACLLCLMSGFLFGDMPSVHELSLEEKIGQLLMVHFHGEEINYQAKKLIKHVHVGGFIYYNWSNKLTDPTQVQKLSGSLQNFAMRQIPSLPLLIAVDQEGGRVNRLINGFTVFPSNAEIARLDAPILAKISAYYNGKQLKEAGINLNLAPVVDVLDENSIMGDRCYGSSPQVVIDFAMAALEGYKEANIISCIKHFPGHGHSSFDSHHCLPISLRTLGELNEKDLLPFSALADHAETFMTAHILFQNIDPYNCVTLSKIFLRDMVRKKMKYKGVVISDSLCMKGVLELSGSIEEAALRAFNAGCDILLLGGRQLHGKESGYEITVDDVVKIHRYLVDAVLKGKMSEHRVNESVHRILSLKKKYLCDN